jgi:hypothetical protein
MKFSEFYNRHLGENFWQVKLNSRCSELNSAFDCMTTRNDPLFLEQV